MSTKKLCGHFGGDVPGEQFGDAANGLFQSQGRGRDQLRNHTLSGAVILGSYLLGLHWGPFGMIMSLAIVCLVIRLPIVYYFAGRQGPVSTGDLWIGFLSHLPCWGAVYLTTTLTQMMVKQSAPIVQLLVCAPIGLAAGAALIFMFRRPRQSANYAWNIFKSALERQWSGTTG
jgi:hypothetical protein